MRATRGQSSLSRSSPTTSSSNLSYLGVRFDYEANEHKADEMLLTLPDSAVKMAVIATNEELVIARDTMHIVLASQE